MPGAVFHDRYRILRCLKAGGMGAVYEVVDAKTERHRALKVMLPGLVKDADLRARFKREATITAPIDSDHIVETFDADVDAETGAPFLVMELLKGEDLSTVLAARGALPPEEVVELLHQVSLALDRTHAAGVIHRDLKPENMFVTRRDDGSPRIKLLDFGIAKIVADSSQAQNTTRSIGTPAYMSPEQINGEGTIGPRSDGYALGHIAYALLAGEPYWSEEQQHAQAVYILLSKVLRGANEPASVRSVRRAKGGVVPASFDPWFAKATSGAPEDRFESCLELARTLAEALDVPPPGRDSRVSAPRAAAAPVSSGVPRATPSARTWRSSSSARGESDPLAFQATHPSAPDASPGGPQITAEPVSQETVALPLHRSRGPFALGALALAAVVVGVLLWGGAAPPATAPSAPDVAAASIPIFPTPTPTPAVAALSSATAAPEALAAAPTALPSAPILSAQPTPKPVAPRTATPAGRAPRRAAAAPSDDLINQR